jgi:hypothetical protein
MFDDLIIEPSLGKTRDIEVENMQRGSRNQTPDE